MKYLLLLFFVACASTKREGFGVHSPPELYNRLEQEIAAQNSKRLVAAFDWDNTTIKNDIGDATFIWMLRNNLFKIPASWVSTSRHLSVDALSELERLCPLKKGKSDRLNSDNTECGKAMLSIYSEGKTLQGKAAWKESHHKLRMEPAYAWAVALLAGYSHQEVKLMAEQVIEHNLKSAIGAKINLFGKDYPDYIRLNPNIKQLISFFLAGGVEVWVISASAQPLVEAFAARLGLPPERVIGVRSVLSQQGRLTPRFLSCGGDNDIITYREGKRCFANRFIFNQEDGSKLFEKSPLFFGAGDSDTDLEFLKDSKLRLVVNRQKTELMCHAFNNQDGGWYVVPMFFEPKSKKESKYDCSKWKLPDQADR